jgi:hypothetical protein
VALPAFFAAIGSDHYLSAQEVAAPTSRHDALDGAWQLYVDQFGAFCGSRLDAQFWRLDHPAHTLGTISVHPETVVVVVGTGPSLARHVATLKRLRPHVMIFTSLRGAEALSAHGLAPDLAIVEHQTPLGAQVTVTQVRDRGCGNILERCPHIAVDRRAPRALVGGVPADRLFIPERLPTWGLWPATAVALALQAGAGCVALLGVDLGTPETPDPSQRPLANLLSLLAQIGDAAAVDCGPEGAPKAGWRAAPLDTIAPVGLPAPIEIAMRPWQTPAARQAIDREHLRRLAPVIGRARKLLALGLRARAGERWSGDACAIEEAAREMLTWGEIPWLRISLQDTLGLSFLPMIWRTGIDYGLGARLWRPAVLALHELVHQAGALEARLARNAA